MFKENKSNSPSHTYLWPLVFSTVEYGQGNSQAYFDASFKYVQLSMFLSVAKGSRNSHSIVLTCLYLDDQEIFEIFLVCVSTSPEKSLRTLQMTHF